jgi:hypothetical protein
MIRIFVRTLWERLWQTYIPYLAISKANLKIIKLKKKKERTLLHLVQNKGAWDTSYQKM